MTQVFVNLLVNAAHAIKDQGFIKLTTWQEDEFIFASVEDNGEGIKPENIEKLFDPFFTTKEVGKGTGLGLSISYGIIEEHGGSIDVRSKVGEGTCFTLKFPINT
ncbi:MAG: ATP-binding protein [Spirochaetaceae bacterium]